jgi:Na+-transporting NADH:ubiquinone oxidoreductase subunit A
MFEKNPKVKVAKFSGPHPAGNVGVQIHHLKPIKDVNDQVWTCSTQAVLQVGKLFTDGKINPEIIIALAGSAAKQQKYYRTITGASLESIIQTLINPENRYISGNILTGKNITENPYLGYYDDLITVIPETEKPEFLGWIKPGINKESNSKTFISSLFKYKLFNISTNCNGSRRAFIATALYKKVLPMDIYPVFLLKSILAADIDEMEDLGILEVAEEDFALCEYVCPSKISIQKIVREGLNLIEKELS